MEAQVKVASGWRDDDEMLSRFGIGEASTLL